MYKAALGNAASFQVSGRPYATGSIDATARAHINFPSVTRWVTVHNSGSSPLRVGFADIAVQGLGPANNYFLVAGNSSAGPLELKITQLHLSGGAPNGVSVCAGLTYINNDQVDNPSKSPTSPYINWTGSAGVG
mgnify:CR=1 FL=1|tara:strand:- start:253 stop:654 length:402 start_codon:yes stop_codon:yes gene_type:complete